MVALQVIAKVESGQRSFPFKDDRDPERVFSLSDFIPGSAAGEPGLHGPGPRFYHVAPLFGAGLHALHVFASRSKRSKTSVLSRRKEGQAARACKKQGKVTSSIETLRTFQ